MSDEIIFVEDDAAQNLTERPSLDPWEILIVDDDQDVHDVTLYALKDSIIMERPLKFFHAYSGREALQMLSDNAGIQVILLDAVMETEDAGLETARIIREEMKLENVRIILRTGQPGQIPELDTITKYDINDYKTKNELTKTKLLTTLIASLRSWQQIYRIDNSRKGLEIIVEASNQFIAEQGIQSFAEGVIIQMASLFDLEPDGILCASVNPFSMNHWDNSGPEGIDDEDYMIIAAAGSYHELIYKRIEQIQNKRIIEAIRKVLHDKKSLLEPDSITVYFEEPSGRSYAAWIASPKPLKELDHHLLEVFCTNISLCASNIELVEQLKRQAWIDPLMKIPNITSLLNEMKNASKKEDRKYNILILADIDNFSQINDFFGHDYGDEILLSVKDRLTELVPEGFFIARAGADAFAILGNESEISEEIYKKISGIRIETTMGLREINLTLGICGTDCSKDAPSTVLNNAFITLKRASMDNQGGILRYTHQIGFEIRERVKLLQNLRKAFAENKLYLMFQPQIRLSDRSVFSVEVLLRWKSIDGKMIPPDVFIPLAEQSGLIVPMGIWILRNALHNLKQIHEAGFPGLRMAINASPVQLKQKDFLSHLDAAMTEFGIGPEFVEIEITESISVIGEKEVRDLLGDIRKRGVSLAVDDFGTGYSSLSSIETWPVNRLKIDRSFISSMDVKSRNLRLLELIIPLGERLSMNVLAEGVETVEQLDKLSELGCDEIQGYLTGKPMEYDDLINWLRTYSENKDGND